VLVVTLTQLRESVPVNIPDLARAAGLDPQTIRNAEAGQRVSARSAKAIADALGQMLGRTIRVQEIDGLQVRI
jgi:transcriptional regulator with XRE-family HTH domain